VNRIDVTQLILKYASTSRPSGEWNDDDFDVLADGIVVGRIMKAAAAGGGNGRLAFTPLVPGFFQSNYS
jgi:hypothetical protein